MKQKKTLLIVEQAMSDLKMSSGDSDVIYLEGIFTEFKIRNRNGRIYEASDFIPKMNELLPKIKAHTLLGELDHPVNFDVSLKNASHVIEKLEYDNQNDRIIGKIRLLNTDAGKQAQALVRDGIPLHISSRAAGQINPQTGKVTLEKLFTYDLVADPGFENAELKRVNEAYGFGNMDNVYIYECDYNINDENALINKDNNKVNNMNVNESKTVNVEDFQKYTEYIAGVIENVKKSINDIKNTISVNESEMRKVDRPNLKIVNDNKSLGEYVDYLAEQLQKVSDHSDYLASELEKSNQHNDYLAEQLEKSINYSDYLSENIDNAIKYGNYLGEKLNDNMSHNDYLAEQMQKIADHSDYLAEKLQKTSDHSDYLAEQLENTMNYSEYLAENVQKTADHSDYLAEQLEKGIAYSEYIAEKVETTAKYADYLAENIENGMNYSEYLAENIQKTADHSDYLAEQLEKNCDHNDYLAEQLERNYAHNDYLAEKLNDNFAHNDYLAEKLNQNYAHNDYLAEKLGENFDRTDKIVEGLSNGNMKMVAENNAINNTTNSFANNKAVMESRNAASAIRSNIKSNDEYKSAITEKLDALLNKHSEQVKPDNFLNFLSEGRRNEFATLDNNTKAVITEAMKVANVKNEEQANLVWKSVYESKKGLDLVENMPAVYRDKWNALSDKRKQEILNESKFYKINTTNEIEYFWSTRDLRDNTLVVERVDTDSARMWSEDKKKQDDRISNILGRTKRSMRGF